MNEPTSSVHDLWARFRHTVVGPLLSSPPPEGELQRALDDLSARLWKHPTESNRLIRLGRSTIEAWYYQARDAANPIEVLRRRVRKDAGSSRVMHEPLIERLAQQYRDHPSWSVQLHRENLVAAAQEDRELLPIPSYATLRRFMKGRGWRRTKRRGNENRPGLARARERLDHREVRSYEVEYVGGMWHLDFHTSHHVGVLDAKGNWVRPILLAILDDHSRLCCHAQFYLVQNTEMLVHGFAQALLKCGLPRELMTDNGGEMTSAEFTQGLERLSILQETTLPYSPYQNGKQEHFWSVVEGRFLAMLDNVKDLTLEQVNLLLQAWIEEDYHRRKHSSTKEEPRARFSGGRAVLRRSPDLETIRSAFRQRVTRRVRRSDGTITIDGTRYEIPVAHRHHDRVTLIYARWAMDYVHLLDPRSNQPLMRIFPIDVHRNASGRRRAYEPGEAPSAPEPPSTLPPLIRSLLDQYQASGLPPAYLSFQGLETTNEESNP